MVALLRVKALFEYASGHEDDLSFGAGQVITVTDQDDADWYGGEYIDDHGVKQEGIFPRNFVEKFEPVAPPRPARKGTKRDVEKETEAPPTTAEHVTLPTVADVVHEEPTQIAEPEPEPAPTTESHDVPPHSPVVGKPAPPVAAPEPAPAAEMVRAPPPKVASTMGSPPAQIATQGQPPKPKPAPPPVSEKPSSFKDRIAAFNKPSAAPIAPFKPGGLAGGTYPKKPFVPPPPSRDAYVPLPKDKPTPPVSSYRRDEDPEIKEREQQNLEQAQKAGLTPSAESGNAGEDDSDQPKPTSLKERIALLQKQQMEQAQRHAEAAAKKEKAKRPPPKKRTESSGLMEAAGDLKETDDTASSEHVEAEASRTSTDDGMAARGPAPPRRKSSKGPVPAVHDGNEADMSGAGDTTEGHDDTTEREDSEGVPQHASRAATGLDSTAEKGKGEESAEEEEEDDDQEEDVDPEVKRKEELRARMAKMSGGMGFHGMFGAPMPPAAGAPPKKKKSSSSKAEAPVQEEQEEEDQSSRPRGAPPIPTMMVMPGIGGLRKSEETSRPAEDEPEPIARAPPPPIPSRTTKEQNDDERDNDEESEDEATTPAPTSGRPVPPPGLSGAPPPIPGGRPAPPPLPLDVRPVPPPPPAHPKTPTDGSQSDDELSGNARESQAESPTAPAKRPLSLLQQQPLQSPSLPLRSPSLSHREGDDSTPSSTGGPSKRNSRPPPQIPGITPSSPLTQSRPPPPPPPGALNRQSTKDFAITSPSRPPQAGEENEDEATEYEGDYDTDIASSVPHKDALKAHARESSQEDNFLQSPARDEHSNEPPPVPGSPPPRGVPPPIPNQLPPDHKRRSVDAPRAAPPPPPKEAPPTPQQASEDLESATYHPMASGALGSSYSHKTPMIEEETYFSRQSPAQSPPERRAPPPAPITRAATGTRKSLDVQGLGAARRSMDRPSMELGFIANDLDLAVQSGWWRQENQVPPALQGRKDIYFEGEESTTTNGGRKTIVTRQISVLFQDYSQTTLTINYDPYDPSDVELGQRHEPPPRALRQDQMEEYYERFGRPISDMVASKREGVVGDGTPQGLVFELLKPFKDALRPIGTRAYGALVYSNMANASTQQHDVIRPGDILTIRNARFQGKHGAMHAKYSMEVGKPDHVGIVAEWDGTKKKVRAWEQGRESKKVKVESFKLDDLRSGEVKIWRVMPRSWVGWNTQS